MGARLANRSCPAVSQISNLIVVSSSTSDLVRNAAAARMPIDYVSQHTPVGAEPAGELARKKELRKRPPTSDRVLLVFKELVAHKA